MTQTSLKTLQMQVGGMDCPSCAGKISTALEKLTGVEEATVNFNNSKLTVAYDSQQIDAAAIRERVTRLGYVISAAAYGDSSHDTHSHDTHSHDAHNHGNCQNSRDHFDKEPDKQDLLAQQHSYQQHDHTHTHHDNHSHDHANHHTHGSFNLKRELPLVLIVITLFVIGLVFEQQLHNTPYSIAEYAIFIPAYLLSGWSVLKTAGRNILRGQIFDENFLMTIATLGAVAIHKLPEAVAVMLFYQIGELFQAAAVDRSRRSIKTLLEIRPDVANRKTANGIETVAPEQVKVGEVVLVKPGEKVPLDGEVTEGKSLLDTSALTGESVPRSVQAGETVLAGMINQTGLLTVKVTKLFTESSIARILELVENSGSKKAVTEKFITHFALRYTPVVVLLSLLVALLPPLLIPGASRTDWLYRALTLLVISCPCGLVISIPLGYFGGIGGAAKRGILVKGSAFLDVLANLKTVVFDKTGTLTQGVFRVCDIAAANGFRADELLQWAAAAETYSNHPIAQSIRQAEPHWSSQMNSSEVVNYQEIAGQGIRAIVKGVVVLVGNQRLLTQAKIDYPATNTKLETAGTTIYVAVDGVYAGRLTIADALKPDAAVAVASLRQLGIDSITMLTGDTQTVAAEVAQTLNLDAYQAELLPEDKVGALEAIMQSKRLVNGKTAFVGDGINDAPAIARADIGIAMGGLGSDAAIETADVVIMSDAPSKIAEAVQMGRRTRQIVLQNIALAMAIKGLFILLGVFGCATLWEAVFADVGVALLAVFNSMRVLK